MEISSGISIHLLDLNMHAGAVAKNVGLSGRNRTSGAAIPVQRSNQLSYRETVVEL